MKLKPGFWSLVIAVAATPLVGCKSTYHVQQYQAPGSLLRPEEGVFIIVPPDAYDEPGSGLKCAETLLEAFRPHCQRLTLSDEVTVLGTHLTNAIHQGFTYVLESDVFSWEEEPTEWTGKSDFLNIELRLLSPPDGRVVSKARFDARSKWATFGGDHVEDLLKPFANAWVGALYEGTPFAEPK
ncbi:MAG: DUF4823 domain-containing protein [Verrucomicrobiae bacterium]|nr:DUF4823 domain-containing protein [Verrucomicrobiae bacterium]